MNNKVDISIIVPVYNSSRFLRQTLDSIFNQTASNFELICVDDGSTDDSLEILNSYADKYSNITVLSQNNQTTGAARNAGLNIAKGEYLLFLDADDFFEATMLEEVFKQAIKTRADVTIFDGKIFDQESKIFTKPSHFLNFGFLPKKEVFNRFDMVGSIFKITNPAPWNKLFKSSFLRENGLRFSVLPNCEDMSFTYSSLALADRITFSKSRLVNYRANNIESLSGGFEKKDSYVISAVDEVYNVLVENDLTQLLLNDLILIAVHQVLHFSKIATSATQRVKLFSELTAKDWIKSELIDNRENFVMQNMNFEKEINSVFDQIAGLEWRVQRERLLQSKNFGYVAQSSATGSALVSVVFPLHNDEETVVDVVESLMNQSLKEIEIICVDDGSTDETLDRLKSIVADERISIIASETSGLSRARNIGMSKAQSDYIYFAQSDTVLDERALEILYSAVTIKDIDIAGCDVCDQNFPSLYKQLFRKNFLELEEITFEEGIEHSEHLFVYEAILSTAKIAYVGADIFVECRNSSVLDVQKPLFLDVYGYFICYLKMCSFRRIGELSTASFEHAQSYACEMLQCARDVYTLLADNQKLAIYHLDNHEKILFSELIVCHVENRKHLVSLEDRLQLALAKSQKADEKYKEVQMKFKKTKKKLMRTSSELKEIKESRIFRFSRKVSRFSKRTKI